MFSKIASQLHAESNVLYRLRDELRQQGHAVTDLISGNINEQGFLFPQDLLEEILARNLSKCRIYRPDSFGQPAAREAVSAYYRGRGHDIPPECILITPGSSISYWYCFKLLADEGDEILCPCPSYPLFDYIALLSGVKLIPYRLDETKDWSIDIDQLEACVSTRTRALVLISPHNPTGHVATPEEITKLVDVARRHELAIISDEVFSEFLLRQDALPRPGTCGAPLIFTLNGFSKMFALPGIKFGWTAVSGDFEKVRRAMRALELISDTFLPVSEIVQAAAPEIFQLGEEVAKGFAARIRKCWHEADALMHGSRIFAYVKPDGGFYVTLRLQGISEERAAEMVLERNHVLIHPGYFYDMEPDHLVFCFVQKPELLHNAVSALIATLDEMAAGN
ncbi:MAG: pyridoxal phosphate-dependent aminotransferase [Acidobacteria bacterium]|nr:pyridoxal phosphate-dependent aminotransferase [Acidobacteriota bacterium]